MQDWQELESPEQFDSLVAEAKAEFVARLHAEALSWGVELGEPDVGKFASMVLAKAMPIIDQAVKANADPLRFRLEAARTRLALIISPSAPDGESTH